MKIWNSTDDLIIEMKRNNNFISKCDCVNSTLWCDFEYMDEIKEVSRDVKLSVPPQNIIDWFD